MLAKFWQSQLIVIHSQLSLRISIRSMLLIFSFSCCLDLDLLGGVFNHRYISWWHVPSDHETRVLAELKLPEDESTAYIGTWCLERLRQSVALDSGSRWWDENERDDLLRLGRGQYFVSPAIVRDDWGKHGRTFEAGLKPAPFLPPCYCH
jgi:hypothetical protein